MSLGNHDLDLPFEPSEPAAIELQDAMMSGGLAIMAAAIPVPGIGKMPSLIYRFARPDGTFYPPMVLVADEDQLTKLAALTASATAAAIRAAS
jgi:hypothetical protein